MSELYFESKSEFVKNIVRAIWEDHVNTKDEVIESAERVLDPILLAALAMRNNLGASASDARAMWDEAVAQYK